MNSATGGGPKASDMISVSRKPLIMDGGAGSVTTHSHDQINMYNEPPQNVISLHEFQKLSLDRLQVLKKIEFM